MSHTLLIAECGSCGDAQLPKMQALIRTAARCGADVAKFQWTSDPAQLAARRSAGPDYERIYRQYIAWPAAWHADLAATCAEEGLRYACTTYLPDDIGVVAPHVALFKIASFEATDFQFIRAHQPYAAPDRPLFISTGLHHAAALQRLIDLCADLFPDGDWPSGRFGLLHCTSAYPAPLEALHLRQLRYAHHGATSGAWVSLAGLSDHADPAYLWTGAVAVAAGARVLERHLRLHDTEALNPDRPHAMIPEAFETYVRHVRWTETALGEGPKRQQVCEQAMVQYRVTSV